MTTLTRRRDRDRRDDHWQIFYGDVRVGTIGKRAGVPGNVDQWGWYCGFHPASQRGLADAGTAVDFEHARLAFDRAWQTIQPRCTEEDFASYRQQRAWNRWKQKMWETGCKLPTQSTDGRSTCYCGATIDTVTMDRHIYAAHLTEEEQASA
ncbi:hypothetical protein [Bradyrhizobium sp. AUGA SZCCT0160]|uniref:hypothetical protein n=1 Tax=Bradyrhizobium sp. AUGA SZCCT0160 TaxID=2807662 RepID=UPI001BA7D0AC|nr:hypothetical protein [Bradyrhizobium sp. AUGA SZCCT0160]MBR1187278.1 hypothetical protein [Bradyrhizobium sp. AUGA SZCCT0160]